MNTKTGPKKQISDDPRRADLTAFDENVLAALQSSEYSWRKASQLPGFDDTTTTEIGCALTRLEAAGLAEPWNDNKNAGGHSWRLTETGRRL